MTTENIFDKENFILSISTFPTWIKTGDDLMTYCKHLNYRLMQSKEINRWYEKRINLIDNEVSEINQIHTKYDDAYNNDVSKLKPFKESFSD